MQLDPRNPVIHYDLGNNLARQSRLDQAAASYQQAISLKPEYAAAHYNLASVRSAAGRHEEAEELMARAIEADSGYQPAHKALAQLRERRGDYDGAIEALEIAVGIRPDDVEARNLLGYLLGKAGATERGRSGFAKNAADRLDPRGHLGALGCATARRQGFRECASASREGHSTQCVPHEGALRSGQLSDAAGAEGERAKGDASVSRC